MAEGNFEAKVHARRETRDGVYITLSVNPADLTPDLAMLRVGSALIIGWSEVIDTSVQPIELPRTAQVATPCYKADQAARNERSRAAVEHIAKERKPFHTLPLSQQAAIRSQDADFCNFLTATITAGELVTFADEVRYRCGVASRAHIIKNTPAGDKWENLEREYQAWLVTQQYADSVR